MNNNFTLLFPRKIRKFRAVGQDSLYTEEGKMSFEYMSSCLYSPLKCLSLTLQVSSEFMKKLKRNKHVTDDSSHNDFSRQVQDG